MTVIKTEEEVEKIRHAGKILAKVFAKLNNKISAGITAYELDCWIKKQVEEYGGLCAFFTYRGYPANSCVSVNEEVVHGVPTKEKVVRDGDIVGIDIGVKYSGYFADAAVTYAIGKVDASFLKLIEAAKKSLDLGIKQVYAGNFLSNISYAIQRYVESCGFSVVRDLAGHGVGKDIHEEPEIPNFGRPDCGIKLIKGMVLAIEPMINMGGWQVETLSDGWTVVTKDRRPSAHFEHTVAVLDKGAEVLTRL